MVGALALIATALGGCSSNAAAAPSNGACGSYGDFTFADAGPKPTLTRASVVTVDRTGAHRTEVPGLTATITPSASVATGPRPDLSVVLTRYKSDTFLYPIPGPSAAPTPSAATGRGTWVTYSGVDLYAIDYTTTCLDTKPPAPMTGTVTAWADPRDGTVDCDDPYLVDLLAAAAAENCPVR